MGGLQLSSCLACQENMWVLSTSHCSPFYGLQFITSQSSRLCRNLGRTHQEVLLAKSNSFARTRNDRTDYFYFIFLQGDVFNSLYFLIINYSLLSKLSFKRNTHTTGHKHLTVWLSPAKHYQTPELPLTCTLLFLLSVTRTLPADKKKTIQAL